MTSKVHPAEEHGSMMRGSAESGSIRHGSRERGSRESGSAERDGLLNDLEQEFEYLVRQMRRATTVNASLVSEGMLAGSYKVFTAIARLGPVSFSTLTDELLVDKGQMSRTLRDLDERGLITRSPDPHDGRSVLLELSEFGRERFTSARSNYGTLLRSSMSDWSAADIRRFAQLLHALSRGLTPEAHER